MISHLKSLLYTLIAISFIACADEKKTEEKSEEPSSSKQAKVIKKEIPKTDLEKMDLVGDVAEVKTYLQEEDRLFQIDEYTFNRQGLALSALELSNINQEGVWNLQRYNLYEYDSQDRLVKTFGRGIVYKEYSEKGLVKEIRLSQGEERVLVYERNQDGNITRLSRVDEKGKMISYEKIYNNDGLEIEHLSYVLGKLQSTTKYEYDQAGRITKEIRGITINTKYDDQGNKIEKSGMNNDGSFRFKYTFDYNKQNRLLKEQHYDAAGNAVSVKEYVYDNGNLIEENYYAPPGTLSYQFNREYADNGILISEKYYESDFTKEKNSTIYELDKKGNWITQIMSENGLETRKVREIKYHSDNEITAENLQITTELDEPYNVLSYAQMLPGPYSAPEELLLLNQGEKISDKYGCSLTLSKKNIRGGFLELKRECGFRNYRTEYVQWNLSEDQVLIGINKMENFKSVPDITEDYGFCIFDRNQWKKADVGILSNLTKSQIVKEVLGEEANDLGTVRMRLQLPEKGKNIKLQIIDIDKLLLENQQMIKEVELKWNEGKFEL